jgi:hypothetical protein
MEKSKQTVAKTLSFSLFSALLSLSPASQAESDKELQEKALKAREMTKHGEMMDHAAHGEGAGESNAKFRGVFYGYLPCHEEECDGIKMTLSLKHNNTYLLIVQPARPRNRETFEKGQYLWNEKTATLMLTPNSPDKPPRRLTIKDETTLLYVNNDGTAMPGDQDDYILARSDKAGNREMHIH